MSVLSPAAARLATDRRTLIWLVIVSLALHVGAAALFKITSVAETTVLPFEPSVQYIGSMNLADLGLGAVRDPSQAALASTHGIAATTFDSSQPIQHPPVLAQHPLKPQIVSTLPPNLTNVSPVELLSTKLAVAAQEQVKPILPQSTTSIVVSQSLVDRTPADAAAGFQLEGVVPEQATVLRIAVDNAGAVRYCLLAESSNTVAADRLASRLVSRWRFAGSADPLVWGEVRIMWAGNIVPAAAKAGEKAK